MFDNVSNGEAELNISQTLAVNYIRPDVKLSSAVVACEESDLNEFLQKVQPKLSDMFLATDIMVFYGLDPELSQPVKNNIPTECKFISLSMNDATETLVVYNTSKFGSISAKNIDGFSVVDVKPVISNDSYRIVHGYGNADDATAIESLDTLLTGWSGYSMVVLDRTNAKLDPSGESLDFVGEGVASLGEGRYSRAVYINGDLLVCDPIVKDSYNGTSCASLCLSSSFKARYAKTFVELTNTAK